MRREYLPPVLNAAAGVGVFVLSVLVGLCIPISRTVGLSLGIALVLWALFHIRSGVTGGIEPKLDVFAQGGPYRFVCHSI